MTMKIHICPQLCTPTRFGLKNAKSQTTDFRFSSLYYEKVDYTQLKETAPVILKPLL